MISIRSSKPLLFLPQKIHEKRNMKKYKPKLSQFNRFYLLSKASHFTRNPSAGSVNEGNFFSSRFS
jgi:hypothetical protein